MKKLIPQSVKNIYHFFQAVLANLIFGFPSRKLKVIGVTGTNGKTTVVQMIVAILEKAGFKTAAASTINFKIGRKEWVNATKFTTLSAFQTQKFIRRAVDAGCEYLVLETSSHSLDQNRVWGVRYDAAVITNVTREHLDYHETMEKYRRAKLKLFRNVRAVAVNLNMENPEDFLNCAAEKKYGYATKIAKSQCQNPNVKFQTVLAENINLAPDGTNYKLKTTDYKLNLPGLFNVENALAAACVGMIYGIPEESIKKALEGIRSIPGRLEKVPNDLGIDIIIDYAVTPDALEKLYQYVSTRKEGKIISVFGACGERDRGKRPLMGEIVSRHADCIILANEDPYGENPERIIDELAAGIKNKQEGENFWKIMDRREAIGKALRLAESGDTVLITGKGAEETMAVGKERIPWNDKKVIREELEKVRED